MYREGSLLGFHLKNDLCVRSRRSSPGMFVMRRDESTDRALDSKVGCRREDEARHQNCHPTLRERRATSGQRNRFAPVRHIRAPLGPPKPFRQTSPVNLQQDLLFRAH